jgi:hypothetical protein
MNVTMSNKTFAAWIAITAVLSLAIGMTAGAGFTIHQADAAIDAIHARDNQDFAELKKNFDAIRCEVVKPQ